MLRRAHRWVGRVGNGLGRLLDLLGSLLGDGLRGDGRLGDDGLLGGGLPGDGLLLHNDVVVDAARLREGET